MTQSASETGVRTWHVPECPWEIEYSLPVLDEIRRIAVDAFFLLPRGGAEIGGILLGTHSAASVRILGFRPMECEHALGPGFALSEKDKDSLRLQLRELPQDPAVRGMQVVGWYHTHTRSEIFLSDADLEIYREFFPEPWQVALVLRPSGMRPTRAAFFFREAGGAIRSSDSYQEFIAGGHPAGMELPPPKKVNGRHIAPAPAAPTRPPNVAPAPKVAPPAVEKTAPPVRAQQKVDPPAAASKPEPKVEVEAPKPEPAPLPPATALLPTHGEKTPQPRVADVNPPVEMLPAESAAPALQPDDENPPIDTRPVEFVPPAFLIPPQPKGSLRWLWVSLLVLLCLGGGAYFTSEYWMPWIEGKPVYLHLQLLDRQGQLGIQWDHEALAEQQVAGGTMEIIEGQSTTKIPLDAAKIRLGSMLYARRTEMVQVHMTVRTRGGQNVEEFTSFVGQKPSRAEAAGQPPAGSAEVEAEKARADLKKQELRVMELEQSLKRMQAQQRMEDERRRRENQAPANRPAASEQPAPARPAVAPTAAPNNTPGNPPPATPGPLAERAAERTPLPTPLTAAPVNGPATGTALAPGQTLSGSWVFSRASKSGSAFQPESVTLTMTEASGQVRGQFAGRYRVPKNQRFNPSVRFNFEGPVRGGSSKFPFVTSDGMKGEIELIRLPNKQDAIEVVWHSERDNLTFDDIFFRKP